MRVSCAFGDIRPAKTLVMWGLAREVLTIVLEVTVRLPFSCRTSRPAHYDLVKAALTMASTCTTALSITGKSSATPS